MKNNILDDIKKIKKLDSGNMLGSLQLLASQVEQIYNSSQTLTIPSNYKNIDKIVVLGMGGSALGAHVIKSVFANELKFPIEIINNYNIPNFVNNNELIVNNMAI
jgi:glucose/mannose-6-phosphate isomerase